MTTTHWEGSLITVEQPVHQQAGGGSNPTFSLHGLRVTECAKSEIAAFIEEHHYSHNVVGVTATHCFRVDRDGELVGAAIFGRPAMNEALQKYSEQGKVKLLELRRFCLIDDTPDCAESSVLAVMLVHLNERGVYRVLSYADPNHGHLGTAYYAVGGRCLGLTAPITEVLWKGRYWSTRNLNHHKGDDKSRGLREDALEMRAALQRAESKKVRRAGKFIFLIDLKCGRRTQPDDTITARVVPQPPPLSSSAVLTIMALRSPKNEAYTAARMRRDAVLSVSAFTSGHDEERNEPILVESLMIAYANDLSPKSHAAPLCMFPALEIQSGTHARVIAQIDAAAAI
jgi:hypothetical protein